MSEEEGFIALGQNIGEEHALFTYLIETPLEPLKAAAHLCREQSTALWKRVNVEEDFRLKHGAKVVEIKELEKGRKASVWLLKEKEQECNTAIVKIAHPTINFGTKIPNLLTAACGEGAFFTPGINQIKLVNVELPEKFLKEFEGPKFGIQGIRKQLQVKDRPFFIGVVKPNIGLKPKDFAEIAFQALLGGLDGVKDDEMLADVSYSPLKERVKEVMQGLFKAEDKTGEKKTFIANITDEVEKLEELHDLVLQQGGNAIMLNAMPVGLSAARMIAKKTKIPLYSHFDFIAPFSRMPKFGVNSELITRMQRLAGFDAVIMPGFGERMITTDEEVLANVKSCLYEMKGNIKKVLPIPGGSDWAGTLPLMLEKIGSVDFSMVPGRGVFGHPQGPEAGAKSLREAWNAIEQGKSLQEFAKNHEALRKAIEAFGK